MFSENNYDKIKKRNNYIGENSKVDHLYPSRTQKLSTLTPTIAKAKIGNRLYNFFYAQNFGIQGIGLFFALEVQAFFKIGHFYGHFCNFREKTNEKNTKK